MGYNAGVSTVKTSTGGHVISNKVPGRQLPAEIYYYHVFVPVCMHGFTKKNKKPIVALHILIYRINKQNGSRGIAPTKFKTFL